VLKSHENQYNFERIRWVRTTVLTVATAPVCALLRHKTTKYQEYKRNAAFSHSVHAVMFAVSCLYELSSSPANTCVHLRVHQITVKVSHITQLGDWEKKTNCLRLLTLSGLAVLMMACFSRTIVFLLRNDGKLVWLVSKRFQYSNTPFFVNNESVQGRLECHSRFIGK
jgi:hypothetical protein